jgi:ferredoxin
MQNDIYRSLQRRLDQYSVGFPATPSGVELKILQHLFSQEHAEVFLFLSLQPEASDDIARRTGRDPRTLATHLKEMAEKGLVNRVKSTNHVLYGAAPFVPGIYEFQVGAMTPELAELYEQLSEEAYHKTIAEIAFTFGRIVPVNEAIETLCRITPYEDAREILHRADRIVVTECICRKQQDLIGKGCDKPRDTCMLFGDFGQNYLDRGLARSVYVEEALHLLDECRAAGLVTQANTSQNPGGMCNCCGDCCMMLRALNRMPKPAEMVFSNYFCRVNPQLCSGCGACPDICPMSAILLKTNEWAEIDLDRCIGCGVCTGSCPTRAMSLQLKPEGQRRIPPAGNEEQMALMAKRRGI